jgi:PAS domain S-box-containing protein
MLDSMLALAPDPMLVLDVERTVRRANERAAELFGYGPGELVGLPVERLLALPGEPDGPVELAAVRRDGSELHVEVSLARGETTEGAALVLSLRDVSERHAREARLREAGQRFQRVFEDGPVGMALVGEDFRLVEVNDAFCRLTGYDAEELRGRTFADITHPDDVDTDLRLARRLFAGEVRGYSIDKRYVCKDGSIVWVELTVSVIRDEHGRPVRGMGLVQDITERRRALADAQTELARLARDRDRILEFAGEGIYHVDERGRITFANPAAGQMLGWTPEELIGKPAEELLDHTRADGTHYLSRRDGTSFPVHFRGTPVRADGATGEVVVFSDESDCRRPRPSVRAGPASCTTRRCRASPGCTCCSSRRAGPRPWRTWAGGSRRRRSRSRTRWRSCAG